MQQKWLTKMLGLNYEIQYKYGMENVVADALSRREASEEQCAAITQVVPNWVTKVVSSCEEDGLAIQKRNELLLNSESNSKWSYQDAVLRHQKRLYIGNRGGIRTKLIDTLHSSQLRGHSGIQPRYMRGKQLFTGQE
ncbi:hypothetical protein ACH5RR_001589 [Cinchona calisaya]|uniref:Uncharacterized protein n=1 Tax=Cinchona calisaya TaxID=153742 RepID=A0ABD3B3X9_9GENT